MYITIKTSKRRVKYHDQHWNGHETYIPSNTPYVQIHNGGIGSNAIYKNYPLGYIEKLIKDAKKDFFNATIVIEKEYSHFAADDIPF